MIRVEGNRFYLMTLTGWLGLREQSRAATHHQARVVIRVSAQETMEWLKQNLGTLKGRPYPWECKLHQPFP